METLSRRTDFVMLAYVTLVGAFIIVFADALPIWKELASPTALPPLLAEPLSSGFFYEWVHAVAERGGARGGAFPSSHVSISTVVVLVTWKHQRPWLYWLVPIYVGLVFATVYGRFHCAVDVFAGWVVAFSIVGWYRIRSAADAPEPPAASMLEERNHV